MLGRQEMNENPVIEKDLDGFLQETGSDLIEKWQADLDDDFRGMMRTALISICRVRQAREAATDSHRYHL